MSLNEIIHGKLLDPCPAPSIFSSLPSFSSSLTRHVFPVLMNGSVVTQSSWAVPLCPQHPVASRPQGLPTSPFLVPLFNVGPFISLFSLARAANWAPHLPSHFFQSNATTKSDHPQEPSGRCLAATGPSPTPQVHTACQHLALACLSGCVSAHAPGRRCAKPQPMLPPPHPIHAVPSSWNTFPTPFLICQMSAFPLRQRQ